MGNTGETVGELHVRSKEQMVRKWRKQREGGRGEMGEGRGGRGEGGPLLVQFHKVKS